MSITETTRRAIRILKIPPALCDDAEQEAHLAHFSGETVLSHLRLWFEKEIAYRERHIFVSELTRREQAEMDLKQEESLPTAAEKAAYPATPAEIVECRLDRACPRCEEGCFAEVIKFMEVDGEIVGASCTCGFSF